MKDALIDAAIPWGEARNVSPVTLEARGSLAESVRGARICVFGCGAVGSVVAEHLARGGVRALALFDNETLEIENLSRHTLGGPEVGQSKAVALARRLNGVCSLAHVRGFPVSLPLIDPPPRPQREAYAVLRSADLVLDCTSDESVFRWLSALGRATKRRVIHVFTNAHARMLTICSSGRHASCARVAQRLFDDIAAARTPFGKDEYEAGVTEVVRGTGCWHSTFPARGSDIAALVAVGLPIIEDLIARPGSSHGQAVVLRRTAPAKLPDGSLDLRNASPLVDVAWAARYR